MTNVISEREELEDLQKENETVMQQIIELQEEIIDMKKMIEKLLPSESPSVPRFVSDSNDNNNTVSDE